MRKVLIMTVTMASGIACAFLQCATALGGPPGSNAHGQRVFGADCPDASVTSGGLCVYRLCT